LYVTISTINAGMSFITSRESFENGFDLSV